jgi:3-phenylpropionate/trans-cinnamate dioxygenase ferredoxin reductase component
MTDSFDVLVVGSGHGGTHAATALRKRGYTGTIAIASAEDEPPYQRPPLSKGYLSKELGHERILMRPPGFWAGHGLTLLGGRQVDSIEARRQEVRTTDGTRIGYGSLIWAAGSTARTLQCQGHRLAGIHTLRSRIDADAVAMELPEVSEVVIVGGGYIGLEVAASLVKLGLEVSVVEPLPRVLSRTCAEPVSRFFEREHLRHVVRLRLGVGVAAFGGANGRLASAVLTDGSVQPAQLAIVGIGARPAVYPLRKADAAGDDGVDVDADGRTTLSDVYAVGDCASRVAPFSGGVRLRLESVQNAVDQAEAVAAALTGGPRPAPAPATFWSDQYDHRLRTVGLSHGSDATIVRGDPEGGSFSVVHLRRGRVAAVESVNAMKDFAAGRGLVSAGLEAEPRRLADPDVSLRDLLRPGHQPAPSM